MFISIKKELLTLHTTCIPKIRHMTQEQHVWQIMRSNPTQGQTQGFDLNNIAHASVNAESLCIPISQIQ